MGEKLGGDVPRTNGISRRSLLSELSKLFALAVVGNAVSTFTRFETAFAPTILDVLKANAAEGKRVSFYSNRGVTVFSDATYQGIPVGWFNRFGNSGVFDPDILLAGNRRARQEQRIVSVVTQPMVTEESPLRPRERITKPLINERPKDAVSETELIERGVTIITDGIEVGFRPGAFAQDSLLRDFQKGGTNKLLIFVVNQPGLSRESFGDPVFDPYRHIIDKVLSSHDLAQERRKLREKLERSRHSYKSQTDDFSHLLDQLSDEELIRLGLISSLRGYSLPIGHEQGLSDTGLVFVAMGKRRIVNYLSIITSPQENSFQATVDDFDFEEVFQLSIAHGLSPNQSYPVLKDFPNANAGTGKFSPAFDPDSKGPLFIKRHELSHILFGLHPELGEWWHEYNVDKYAGQTIAVAEQKMRQGDDSEYYIYGRTTEGYYVFS